MRGYLRLAVLFSHVVAAPQVLQAPLRVTVAPNRLVVVEWEGQTLRKLRPGELSVGLGINPPQVQLDGEQEMGVTCRQLVGNKI